MSKKKCRVLIVHNYYQIPGGEDTVVANEEKMLRKKGCHVVLYTRNNKDINNIATRLFLPFTTIFSLRTYRDIKKIIKKEKIDVVHVHNTLNLISPSVYYAALHCKVPVVQTIHNFRMICPGATLYRDGHICEECLQKGVKCAIKHRCYRNSKVQTLAVVMISCFHKTTGIYRKINYICLTEFNKQMLLKHGQIDESHVFVKPNSIEDSLLDCQNTNRKNQFVFAGRIDALKGIDILLSAWKQMGSEAPKLLICGTGPMEEWAKDYVKQNKLSSVEFTGLLPNHEVRNIVAQSRALILPTQWYEGFPMSIVEAFSVGTPVIGSDIGNVGSIIKDGINGEKFPPKDADALAHCVIRMDVSPQMVFRHFQENYTQKKNVEELCAIYEKMCERETI